MDPPPGTDGSIPLRSSGESVPAPFRALVPGRNFREGTTNRTNESLNPATAGAVFRSAEVRLRCSTRSIVEPDVFHAPAIEDAVGRQGHAFDVRLPASGTAPVEDDRP